MPEKVIHEDSTRYIVESLQDGMNKRKTASVYTQALTTLQIKSLGVISQFGRKAIITDTNLAETLQLQLQYGQEQEKNFCLFDAICKSWETGKTWQALG